MGNEKRPGTPHPNPLPSEGRGDQKERFLKTRESKSRRPSWFHGKRPPSQSYGATGRDGVHQHKVRADAGSWAGTACLLYTSDAADDLLCVDLGGRRIIKKKK